MRLALAVFVTLLLASPSLASRVPISGSGAAIRQPGPRSSDRCGIAGGSRWPAALIGVVRRFRNKRE